MSQTEGSSTPTPVAWPELERPEKIGPYKIIRLLGEGGMGVVYLAEQQKPVRRRVALKIIRPGMDSRNVIARFESERQALALMDHPGVARVLDAGSTDKGRPYFVMEYVRGLPLLEACDRLRLTNRDRLDLFIQICRAVQHAHQKGILHRDLKPSNVLVYLADGRPVPKVIDFGLAKATDQTLSEKTVFTRLGTLIGTPTYMSPEQAGFKELDIDTRSDVYSLGVLLYRLLVGAPPFNLIPYVRRGALEEMRRIICEEIPPRPSSMMRLQGRSAAKKVALARRTNPSTLARRLRGDIDSIVLRALEKKRARRYGSAIELAADITRHLNHEPVLAGPPRASYRLKKLLLKHRTVFIFVSLLIIILSAGVVMSTRFYLVASRRAQEAERLAEEASRFRASFMKSSIKEREQTRLAEASVLRARESERRAEENQRRAEKNEILINEQRERGRRLAEENRRLADIYRLARLNREAERLLPTSPEGIEAMEAWISRAEDMTRNLHDYEMQLEAISASLAREQPRESWARLQWEYETLSELVEGMRRFISLDPARGTLARVQTRLSFARTVRGKTVELKEDEWREAVSSIANPLECPAYEGLRITPQVGLIPLGRNPDTLLWEFYHLGSGEAPIVVDDGSYVLGERTGLVFVLVPGGTFLMGSPGNAKSEAASTRLPDPYAEDVESPLHPVALRPFFISRYEMTQAQWERIAYTAPSLVTPMRDPGRTNRWNEPVSTIHPVEMVSWVEADRALRSIGLGLPTEAQWEYAARGGAETLWWTGDEVEGLEGAANLADRFRRRRIFGASVEEETGGGVVLFDDGYLHHGPVGRFRPNRYGLHDVHGNLAEFCRDVFGSYSFPVTAREGERRVASSIPSPLRVARGGSFADEPRDVRLARRQPISLHYRSPRIGIRPVRLLSE